MHFTKHCDNFVLAEDNSLKFALEKLRLNKNKIVFVVNANKELVGALSDGDVRNYIIESDNVDTLIPIKEIMNRDLVYCHESDSHQKIKDLISDRINVIPIVDDRKHIAFIAKRKTKALQFGEFHIDKNSPSFIIAEIGNNHNGSIDCAKKLVKLAKESGADCAKFQIRDLASLYSNSGDNTDAAEDLGSQYTLDLLAKFSLKNEEMIEVFDYCKEIGILPLCTPWDLKSLELLEDYGMPAYKIASADLTNHILLEEAAKTGKPLIVSTGMSSEKEIREAADLLSNLGAQFAFLHCNSTYPTPYKDIQLQFMPKLEEIGGCLFGYSGHERGIHIPIAAVSLGAKIVEKHFTLDKEMEGNDHKVSLLPNEFAMMVEQIRHLESALDFSGSREISQGEIMNRETLGKSVVALTNIKKGDIFNSESLGVKSPGKGLPPYMIKEIVGKVAQKDIKPGAILFHDDFMPAKIFKTTFDFSRPWGVPVRYHDFNELAEKTNLDLVEFHLSYKDLELNPSDYISAQMAKEINFIVHAPELFAGDHILDLASPNQQYREKSIELMQEVVDVTCALGKLFPKTKKPLIITNVGGFTKDRPLSAEGCEKAYELLKQSLAKVELKGTEIIAQTMPPYPWHFGGQSFHNIFLDPRKIKDFCQENSFRICFDVSHSKLACNKFDWSWSEFIDLVAPYTAHSHIVDARGVDGEGLQIGEGSIDFEKLAKALETHSPGSSFIPEIWQGHKNNGEGFWIALSKLEKWF